MIESSVNHDTVTNSPTPITQDKTLMKQCSELPKPSSEPGISENQNLPVRRSVRERHPPKKLDDYVLNK